MNAEQERRMDIFMCNVRDIEASFGTTMEENIIVELKAPKVILSKKVLEQIEDYMDFVESNLISIASTEDEVYCRLQRSG